jgi:hypothetical protein
LPCVRKLILRIERGNKEMLFIKIIMLLNALLATFHALTGNYAEATFFLVLALALKEIE